MKKKIQPQVRVGICAGPDLLPEWQELFKSSNYLIVEIVAPSHKVLMQQLDSTSDYYHLLLFIDCHLALKSNGKLLQQLMDEYPGIKLIALLHDPYKSADIIQLLKYGCNNFVLQKNIVSIKEELKLAIHKAEYNHNMRDYITEWLYNTDCLVTMSYHLARLLRLIIRKRSKQDIKLLKGMTDEEAEHGMREMFDTLSDIGFTENIVRQGLSEPDPGPKQLQHFNYGTDKVFEEPDKIVMIRVFDDYVRVYLDDGTISLPFRTTLKELETDLTGTNLIRVSNSEMVNIRFVKMQYNRDLIKLRIDYNEKRQITLGDKYRAVFLEKMGLK